MEKTHDNQRPVTTVRLAGLKATVWQNTGKNGTFHSVQITRTYKNKEGQYADSTSFNRGDLLSLAHLVTRVYDELSIAAPEEA